MRTNADARVAHNARQSLMSQLLIQTRLEVIDKTLKRRQEKLNWRSPICRNIGGRHLPRTIAAY